MVGRQEGNISSFLLAAERFSCLFPGPQATRSGRTVRRRAATRFVLTLDGRGGGLHAEMDFWGEREEMEEEDREAERRALTPHSLLFLLCAGLRGAPHRKSNGKNERLRRRRRGELAKKTLLLFLLFSQSRITHIMGTSTTTRVALVLCCCGRKLLQNFSQVPLFI